MSALYSGNPGMSVHPGPGYCYVPCDNGLSVTGQHPDGVNCFTVCNLSVGTPSEAQAIYDSAKAECEVSEDEADDMVVDLQMDNNLHDSFYINRQMLDRLVRLATGADRP